MPVPTTRSTRPAVRAMTPVQSRRPRRSQPEPPYPSYLCAIDSMCTAPALSPPLPHLEHKSEVAHRWLKVVSSPGAPPLLRVSVTTIVVLSSVDHLRSPLLSSMRSQPEHRRLQRRHQSSETAVDTLPSRATFRSTPRRRPPDRCLCAARIRAAVPPS
jgi:hypothetical protein